MSALTVENLPPIIWSDAKVITTELLAKLYDTDAVRIRQNFASNASRFTEGKHFHKVTGSALTDLRVALNDSQISTRARSLILWTERGAARHAKMLETNKAWDVFESLEDHYFRRIESDDSNQDISTVRDRLPLLYAAVSLVVTHHLLFGKVYRAMNYYAGTKCFKEMSKADAKEAGKFIERLLAGMDTRQDWNRIEANKAKLGVSTAQPELIGFMSNKKSVSGALA